MTAGTFGHFISELESKDMQDIPERVWINPRCPTFTGARLHLEASWARVYFLIHFIDLVQQLHTALFNCGNWGEKYIMIRDVFMSLSMNPDTFERASFSLRFGLPPTLRRHFFVQLFEDAFGFIPKLGSGN